MAEHFLDRALKIAEGDDELMAQMSEQYAILFRRQGKWQEVTKIVSIFKFVNK